VKGVKMQNSKTVKKTGKEILNMQIVMRKLTLMSVDTNTAYTLGRNADSIYSHWKHIEEQRIELIKKYGLEAEDGSISVLPENEDEFNKEYEKSLQKEFDVELREIEIGKLKALDSDLDQLEIFRKQLEKLKALVQVIPSEQTDKEIAVIKLRIQILEECTTITAQHLGVVADMLIDNRVIEVVDSRIIH
jgi:hypothetical protein